MYAFQMLICIWYDESLTLSVHLSYSSVFDTMKFDCFFVQAPS